MTETPAYLRRCLSLKSVAKLRLAQPTHPSRKNILDALDSPRNLTRYFPLCRYTGNDATRQLQAVFLRQFHDGLGDFLRAHT